MHGLRTKLLQTSQYYDQWEPPGGNYRDFLIPVMEDDPCDLSYYHLASECDWTGEPFQNHKWMLGVVELTGSEAVNILECRRHSCIGVAGGRHRQICICVARTYYRRIDKRRPSHGL
jgi:hypothetical protein